MSFDALTWAHGQDVGEPLAKLVLYALAGYARRGSALAWPSGAELAECTALSRKTVVHWLAHLKRLGLIQDSGQRRGTTGQVIVYRLSLDQPGLDLGGPKRRKLSPRGAALKRSKESPQGDSYGQAKESPPRDSFGSLKESPQGDSFNGPEESPQRNRPPSVTVTPQARKSPPSVTGNKEEQQEEERPEPKTQKPTVANLAAVFDAWNAMASAHDLPVARALTDDRKTHLRKRLAEHGLDPILEAIANVPQSPFLLGSTGWKADFDFLLRPARLNKLIEGAYSGADRPQSSSFGHAQTQDSPKMYEIINRERASHDR